MEGGPGLCGMIRTYTYNERWGTTSGWTDNSDPGRWGVRDPNTFLLRKESLCGALYAVCNLCGATSVVQSNCCNLHVAICV
eukprot:9467643-Pyramimonas_sp.AAC.1